MAKGNPPVSLVLGLLPYAGPHQRPAVPAAEIVRLLAVLLPPFVEALAGDDAAPLLQVAAELPPPQAVRAGIQKRRAWLAVLRSD